MQKSRAPSEMASPGTAATPSRTRFRSARARSSQNWPADGEEAPRENTLAGRVGARYAMLVWEVPAGLDLDADETQWEWIHQLGHQPQCE